MPTGYKKDGTFAGKVFTKGMTSIVKGKHWKIKDTSRMGHKYSSEEKKKQSNLAKRKKFGHWMVGKKHSKETRIKMSMIHKKRVEDGKHNFWKGGIDPINHRIRNGIEMNFWRETIFRRDNWVCQICNQRGGRLNAHHIRNFAKYSELRFALDNGITLCVECHNKFHNIYGRENNNENQLSEYIETKVERIP